MSRLEEFANFYRSYFLEVQFHFAGTYSVHGETAIFDHPWVNITRPGEDWCLIIEQMPDAYLARLAECYAGTELCQFCFQEINALLPILNGLQMQIDLMTQLTY